MPFVVCSLRPPLNRVPLTGWRRGSWVALLEYIISAASLPLRKTRMKQKASLLISAPLIWEDVQAAGVTSEENVDTLEMVH